LIKAQGAHSQQELEKEAARAERTASEARELKALVERMNAEMTPLRAEAQRAGELKIAEEKARSDGLKMRQFAEKAANELRATRAALEKLEASKKVVEGEGSRAKAELDDIKNAQKAGEQLVAQARLEGEQRIARMNELTQQVQRLTAAREASEKGRLEAEQEVARARLQAEQEIGREKNGLADQVQRLTAELTAAKKQRADAVASAQQAKAESEQIKRLAAEKIKQAQAAARESQTPRTATVKQPQPAIGQASQVPMPADLAAPTATTPRMVSVPGGPGGLAPPVGAPVSNPGFQMQPPGSAPPAQDPYSEQKTVLIEKPVIPSAARGDKG
jgi:hypothetical protein